MLSQVYDKLKSQHNTIFYLFLCHFGGSVRCVRIFVLVGPSEKKSDEKKGCWDSAHLFGHIYCDAKEIHS